MKPIHNYKNEYRHQNALYILIIFSLAIALKLIYFTDIKSKPIFWALSADSQVYNTWGTEIVDGSRTSDTALLSRGYSYYLATIYRFFPEKYRIKSIALSQLLLGSLNSILIYLIACTVISPIYALIAAILSLFYGISFFYECTLVNVTLINFFNLLSLLCLLKGIEKKLPFLFLSAGVFLGGSALIRPNILLFALASAIWIAFINKQLSVNERKRFTIFLTLGFIIGYVPLWQYNSIRFHSTVTPLTSAGINFFIGNNSNSTGTFWQPMDFEARNVTQMIPNFTRHANELTGVRLTPSEVGPALILNSMKFIITSPFQWSKLIIRKLHLLFNSFEIPSNLSFNFYKDRAPLLKLFIVNFGMILSLGIIGLFLNYFVQMKYGLLHVYLATYLIALLLFFIHSEYRYPMVPVLQIFSVVTLKWCIDKIRSREFYKVLKVAACVILTIIVTNIKIPAEINRSISMLSHFNAGLYYSDIGDHEEALSLYKTAQNEGLKNPMLLNKIGIALMKLGDEKEALKTFERAMLLYPDSANTYNIMGKIFYEKRELQKAKRFYMKTIELDPTFSDAYNGLGIIYFLSSRYKESVAMFGKTIELNPKHVNAHNNMGSAYYHMQNYSNAIKFFKKSSELKPDYPSPYLNLGRLYHENGQYIKALDQYEMAYRLLPRNDEIARKIDMLRKMK